ncbi:MAG: TRAP transporter small permease, partial [Burkholderiales bacterium]
TTIMNALDRVLGALARVLLVAAGLAMVLMMMHIVADVAMKYVLNDPIDGTTEVVAAYYMTAIVFLPFAYVALSREHLDVTLFTQRLSGPVLKILTLLGLFATVLYLGFVSYHGASEAIRRTAEGEAWETAARLLDVWPGRWLLPIGMGAMGLCVAAIFVRVWRTKAPRGPAGASGPVSRDERG